MLHRAIDRRLDGEVSARFGDAGRIHRSLPNLRKLQHHGVGAVHAVPRVLTSKTISMRVESP